MVLADALETLHLLPDWESRYAFVIELAKELPPMPESEKIQQHMVRGCTSQVWLTHSWTEDGKLNLHLASDALIVSGLLALVYLTYQGLTATQIQQTDLSKRLEPTHLLQHLSPNRRSGFASVLARIGEISRAAAV